MSPSCGSPSLPSVSSRSFFHAATPLFYSRRPWPCFATSLHTRDRFINLSKSSPSSTPHPSPLVAHRSSGLAKPWPSECCWASSLLNLRAESGTGTPLPLSENSSNSLQLRIVISFLLIHPRFLAISGAPFTFFQELGFTEKELVLLLKRNQELRLVPENLLRARVALLRSVGIDGLDLSYLIAKSPFLLTADEIDSLLCFIRDELEGKIVPAQLKRLLTSTEPLFLASFEQKVNVLFQYGVPREKVVYILNNVNLTKALCLKTIGEIKRLIDFLGDYGGVDLIVRRPVILNYNLDEQLVPRVQFLLQISGGDRDATGSVIRKLPAILSYSVEHVEGHVKFLRSFAGLKDYEIFRIILVFPNMISASIDRKLRPRIEFLKQCGLGPTEIFKFLAKAPLYLGLSFEDNLAHKLGILVKIGYKFRTKELAVAIGAVTRTSCENLQKVVGLFLVYGFSCSDILAMSKKHPQVLQYNPVSLEEKVEYLVGEMGRELEELLAFPAFLGYRLDSRIKHRYEAKREIMGEGMSLNKLLSVSAERFSGVIMKKMEKTDENRSTFELPT